MATNSEYNFQAKTRKKTTCGVHIFCFIQGCSPVGHARLPPLFAILIYIYIYIIIIYCLNSRYNSFKTIFLVALHPKKKFLAWLYPIYPKIVSSHITWRTCFDTNKIDVPTYTVLFLRLQYVHLPTSYMIQMTHNL